MFSVVSERLRYFLGPQDNFSRKRTLEREFSDDGDSDLENVVIVEPALKRSRYHQYNGDSGDHLRSPIGSPVRRPSLNEKFNKDNIFNSISTWMSSLGWNSADKRDNENANNTKVTNADLTTPSFTPSRRGTGALSRHDSVYRRPMSSTAKLLNGYAEMDDVQYMGSTPREAVAPLRWSPRAVPTSPPFRNGIDSGFRFSPTITSTATRVPRDTYKDSKNLLGDKYPITKDFPIIRNKHSLIHRPNKFMANKSKNMFETFTSTILRKNSANPRESFRLEEKIKYQQLLQQHANSGLASSTFKFPLSPSRSSTSGSIKIVDVKCKGGALVLNKLSTSRMLETSGELKGRPSIHASTAVSPITVNHVNEKKETKLKDTLNAIKLDSTAALKKDEIKKVDGDDDLLITAEFKSPVTIRNSLEENLKDSVVYRKDWLKDFQREHEAKKKERERETEATIAYKQKLEKRNAQSSLDERVARKLALLDLTFPPQIKDLPPEIEELPQLTEKMEHIIDGALSRGPPGYILADKFNIHVTRRDIATLAGLNWLNDEVVNFYMSLLMERGKQSGNYLNVYAFNTFFYPKLLKTSYATIRRWTKKVDVFSQDLLLVPIHLGMHWCLAVMDNRDKTIKYYDSMLGDNNNCLQALMNYLNDEHLDKKKSPFDASGWTCENIKEIPQQMNGSDCGMFACKFAEYLSRNVDITFDQEDMPYFRRRMVYEIVSKSLL